MRASPTQPSTIRLSLPFSSLGVLPGDLTNIAQPQEQESGSHTAVPPPAVLVLKVSSFLLYLFGCNFYYDLMLCIKTIPSL